ncbi:MAG: ATP-grasp domain-containing protein [Nanoarchaeota archaeon]|nr:ATP-grasp domain-containing protein [Nanoarchaeota archaeon]
MKNLVAGYLWSGKGLGKEEKIFLKVAKKKNIRLIMVNIFKNIDENKLEEKLKDCEIIYNNTAEEFAIEYVKTVEEWGKKVIDSSRVYYYTEDKWMFFLKCKEKNIPTPDTILLCENITLAKKELKNFNKWPVILKRVEGTCGEFVEKAQSLEEAGKIIRKLWKKGCERHPIIAQEFIDSPSYRVTVIGKKIAQAIIKENKSGWKATGVHAKKFKKFKVDKNLKKLVKRIREMAKISICGIDFVKKGKNWIVLEVNAQPAFDFVEKEREKLVCLTLQLLQEEARKN